MKMLSSFFLLLLSQLLVFTGAAPQAALANPTEPLEQFHTKFFFGLFISDDEALFEETFDTGYSADLVQNGNGVDFTFDTFKAFVSQQRKAFTNRTLVSSRYAIVPDDSTGLTGNVGHIAVVSAVLNGAPVDATIVAVLTTKLDANGNQVNTAERFVLQVQPA
ncbi:hypothetical protein GQ53DRAFT_803475 [Thozetella sp. PMI_491]|nr:hypothetical protein GQ53DRAFT_803475 [Thozetella sp. PMI_491]